MAILSVEKRLAMLEAKVFKNKTDVDDTEAKVDYIIVCDYPEVFDDDEADEEMEADYEAGV